MSELTWFGAFVVTAVLLWVIIAALMGPRKK